MRFITNEITNDIPTKEALLLADALLFSVYGWKPNKVRKMELSSIIRWVGYAKKRMTWGDAYLLSNLLESKKKSLWQKVLSKIRRRK